MIQYPEFIAKGWQIGSGPTEATCKTLTARLGSGMPGMPTTPRPSWPWRLSRKAGNGTCAGKVRYGQRVEYARKFCQTLGEECRKERWISGLRDE